MAHLAGVLGSDTGLLVDLRTRDCLSPQRESLWAAIVGYAFDVLAPDTIMVQLRAARHLDGNVDAAIAVLESRASEPVSLGRFHAAVIDPLDDECRVAVATVGPYLQSVVIMNGQCEAASASDFGETMSLLSTKARWPATRTLLLSIIEPLPAATYSDIDLSGC